MLSECVIQAEGLGKRYALYDAPRDRLKQFLLPRIQKLFRRIPQRYYHEFTSLADVSFEVRKGETLGIVGRNGAGKSTLLQMLCGTLQPSDGKVNIKGRVAALLELGAGFNPEFSGRDNVYMNARLLGLTEDEIQQRFDAIEEFADIGEFIEQPVKTYSSGMYVRLAFAVIAHVDADVLIIDEALAVGDAYFAQKCMRFLRKFKTNGTLLFVSHDAGAVINLCDRAIWLERGRLVKSGPAKEVMEGYLEDLYRGVSSNPTTQAASAFVSYEQEKSLDVATVDVSPITLEEPIRSSQTGRFGNGEAVISGVVLRSVLGGHMASVHGGEVVSIEILAEARKLISKPIIGFIVKDRLGQHLFGENTYLSHAEHEFLVVQGNQLQAIFTFQMPILPRGDYSITAAIAEGSQDDHKVYDWVHDAIFFQSHSVSKVTGLVGLPMQSIVLNRESVKSTC